MNHEVTQLWAHFLGDANELPPGTPGTEYLINRYLFGGGIPTGAQAIIGVERAGRSSPECGQTQAVASTLPAISLDAIHYEMGDDHEMTGSCRFPADGPVSTVGCSGLPEIFGEPPTNPARDDEGSATYRLRWSIDLNEPPR